VEKRKSKSFKRLSIEQHRELLQNQRYRHKASAHVALRLREAEEEEIKKEIKDYLNGKEPL